MNVWPTRRLQLVEHELDLREEADGAARSLGAARGGGGSRPPTPGGRSRRRRCSSGSIIGSPCDAAFLGPERLDLGEDPLAELVARPGERERDVRVQALELPRVRRAADPERRARRRRRGRSSRRPARAARAAAPRSPRSRLSARSGSRRCRLAPALDAAGRLEARDRGDEVAAGQLVRRRERLAGRVVRRLLGDRRAAERAADGDAAERARRPAELPGDDLRSSIAAEVSEPAAAWWRRHARCP